MIVAKFKFPTTKKPLYIKFKIFKVSCSVKQARHLLGSM